MRYITQFEIHLDVVGMDKFIDQRIEYLKKKNACDLGNFIAEKIGFEEIPHEGKKYKLEVQCFSQQDWIELKHELQCLALDNKAVNEVFKKYEKKGLLEPENKEQ